VSPREPRVGLVMGGGGIVGVWWEVGVLAALRARIAWDPATATVIAGTSAGSMAGSYVALGYDLDKLIEERTADAPSAETRSFGSGDVTTMLAQELMGLYLPMMGPLEQRARRAGQLALEHGGVMDEAAYLAMMAKSVGTDAWPDADLRMTTVDCETGETHLIDRGFGMDLATAVAASCAVPTIFPPVEHEGRHYTDGPRGPFIVELAAEKDLDAVVFVGPRLVPPGFEGADEHAELDALEAKGMPIARITGGDRLFGMLTRLMDPSAVPEAAEVGREDGAVAADHVRRVVEEART
jgi:NTE family protein